MALVLNGTSDTITGLQINSANIVDGSIVNADINDLAASKLTGALPAISGAALTGIETESVAFFASQSAAQAVTNGTYTKVVNLDYNTQGNVITQNTGSSWANNRFTVASGQEGAYFLFGHSAIDDVQRNDSVNIRFYKNGSNTAIYATGRLWYSGGSTPNQILSSGVLTQGVNLAVGDYVELYVYHNEGSTEWTEEWLTYFGGFKL